MLLQAQPTRWAVGLHTLSGDLPELPLTSTDHLSPIVHLLVLCPAGLDGGKDAVDVSPQLSRMRSWLLRIVNAMEL